MICNWTISVVVGGLEEETFSRFFEYWRHSVVLSSAHNLINHINPCSFDNITTFNIEDRPLLGTSTSNFPLRTSSFEEIYKSINAMDFTQDVSD
ncbi:hypothetical protein ABKN59_003833 [Abortiporus biennis]